MTSEAQRLAALVQKNADLWDKYGPEWLDWWAISRKEWCCCEGLSFKQCAFVELRPRRKTITVTVPEPETCALRAATLTLTFRDHDGARAASDAISAAIKEQDDE